MMNNGTQQERHMTSEFRIRVTMLDGKQPVWEMMHKDAVIGELSFVEVIDFAAQATSVLRYQDHEFRPAKR
jgi:hypothetical protein